MNRLFFLILLSTLFLCSCGQVRSLTPVIEETETSLQRELEGVWKIGDGVFHIAFTEDNVGQFAWIEEKDGEFEMGRGQLHALRSEEDDEFGFLSLRVIEGKEEEENGYVFAGFRLLETDSLVVWNAGPVESCQSLLENEGLAGEVMRGRYSSEVFFLDGPGLVSHIEDLKDFFELEDPAILTRIISEDP